MNSDIPIEFVPKEEARFVCPESFLQPLLNFLNAETITILGHEHIGKDSHGNCFAVMVSDVECSESRELISRFKESLNITERS